MGDILEYICLKVCLLSASFVLSNKAPQKSFSPTSLLQGGGFVGLISGKKKISKSVFFFFFFVKEKKKKKDKKN